MTNTGDHLILRFASRLLDDDNGLSAKQYFALQEYVYDEVGPTAEMQDLFDRVSETDSNYYIKKSDTV